MRSYLQVILMMFTIPPVMYFIMTNKSVRSEVRQWLPGIYSEKNFLTKIIDIKIIFSNVVI